MAKKLIQKILPLLIGLGFFGIIKVQNNIAEQLKEIEKNPAGTIYDNIIVKMVRTFPVGKLLKEGIDQPELAGWQNFTVAAGRYIEQEVKQNKVPKEYQTYITDLYRIAAWLDNTIKGLRVKGLQNIPPDQLPAGLEGDLRDAQQTIKVILRDTNEMIRVTLEAIDNNTRAENNWRKKTYTQNVTKVFPQIDTFLEEYLKALEADKKIQKHLFLEKAEYTARQEIISKYETGTFAIHSLLEKLRKVAYLEKHRYYLLRRYFNPRNRRLIDSLQVIKDIQQNFPGIISPYMVAKFKITQEKTSLIILGTAFALNGAFQGLQKELAAFLESDLTQFWSN